ncbi:hypothetical protein MRB53_039838 [Persea americana]|nr:hypothetical protein MRB53_039838 [Persea americana]
MSSKSVCLACRLALLSRAFRQHQRPNLAASTPVRSFVHASIAPSLRAHRHVPLASIQKRSNSTSPENVPSAPEPPPVPPEVSPAQLDSDNEAIARDARQYYGDYLPEDALNDAQYKIYERLFGTPRPFSEAEEDAEGEEADGTDLGDVLYREGADGKLEVVSMGGEDSETSAQPHDESDDALDHDARLALDMQEAQRHDELEDFEEDDDPTVRAHPLTPPNRFTTDPRTIIVPRASITGPVSVMLADKANKHLDATAVRIFGGPSLPYSTGTPLASKTLPQKPIPLSAFQSKMAPMEADVYMATVLSGTYAACISILTEVRKRLGAEWLRPLLTRKDDIRVLDAGGAGAGIVAFNEILAAEAAAQVMSTDAPKTKATIVTASPALRARAALLSENTTFIPRLPDYVHASADARVKHFDVIVAPHALWCLAEDYERRQRVQTLWEMLEPDGGLLVLLEKGIPRGFEVIAGARDLLLSPRLALAADPSVTPGLAAGGVADVDAPSQEVTIVAPCTNHQSCPLYPVPGVSRARKDWCHFAQRFERPPYLQRLIGARDRNHEDVKFSYVAAMRRQPQPQFNSKDTLMKTAKPVLSQALAPALAQAPAQALGVASPSRTKQSGILATDLAFAGYEDATSHGPLPRQLSPPLKRHGHIVLDVCTPAGTLERWTVPKSFSRQAYRDARKSRWGDLWALGAKTRVARNVRLGVAGGGKAKGEGSPLGRGSGRVVEKERGRLKARRRKRELKASAGRVDY